MSDDPFIVIGSVIVWILGIGGILGNPTPIHTIGVGTGLMSHPLLLSTFGAWLAVLIAVLGWTVVVFGVADLYNTEGVS